MTCFVCKGNIKERTTTFMADLETCLVVIRNVPSLVCTQCGEVSYTDEVSKKIEQIVLSLKNKITDDLKVRLGGEFRLHDNLSLYGETMDVRGNKANTYMGVRTYF